MQITIDLPNDFVELESNHNIQKEMQLSYALWLFKAGRVTIAKAAQLAGLDLYNFMQACKDNQVPVIDVTREELLEEIDA